MATQKQATPILKGDDAYSVLEQLKKKSSASSKRGAMKLKSKFSGKIRRIT